MEDGHETIPVKVWCWIDRGIAGMVEHLNSRFPRVQTHASCQGTIGEGGRVPAQVMITWDADETLNDLLCEYDITLLGPRFGYAHPR